MTTDTPRTDAEIWDVVYHHKNEIVVDADFARELERELAEAKAEVERLRGELQLAVMLAEEVADEWVSADFFDERQFIRLRSRINQIKATINPTDK